MSLQSRVFSLAKDVEHPEGNQDVWQIDRESGIAVVADGVASGIFSRQWAGILAEAAVADPPDFEDREAFREWLAQRRRQWNETIDTDNLAWHQEAKLREGAFSTLLWVHLDPDNRTDDRTDTRTDKPADAKAPDAEAGRTLKCYAIGDSCLFHLRGGKLLESFPVETSQQLLTDPLVLGSIDLNRDRLIEFAGYQASYAPGDLIVMCTDAVADWAFKREASGKPPCWQDYWDMPEEAWRDEVEQLRVTRQMRYDDATLLILRLSREVARPRRNR